MDKTASALIRALELQAAVCVQMGSPFSGMVAQAIAADMGAGGAFAALAEPWTGHDLRALIGEAAPLRFMGGLHYLVLTGAAPMLAAEYPPAKAEPDAARLTSLVAETGRTHQDMLARFFKSPPQTNEVNRSLCLIGGFLTVARRTGLPLRCLELGASAGLNLNWDRYRYELGEGRVWGDPSSPVRLTTEWTGGAPPLDASVSVVERRGCDQAPIDVADQDQALRLKAYFWPDQGERIARLDGAIALARRHPPAVERADAAVWARTHARGAPGTATVLYHSVFWQYLDPATQAGIAATVAASAESASATAPFAWLRMEVNPADLAAPLDLTLALWPGGDETLLARVHPHGAKVWWMGD